MNCCVTGLQWGDEGKGKVVVIVAVESDIVVRYNGGANAGHTVAIGENKFALHLLPSGSVRENTLCIIANGVVIDPECLLNEIDELAKRGINLDKRLFISENAHLGLDYHKTEDKLREEALGKNKIGTTIRGIGPCYADKVLRSNAVRLGDLQDLNSLKEKLSQIIDFKNKFFGSVYNASPLSAEQIFEKCKQYSNRLLLFITDTTEFLHKSISEGKSILFEGAQGSLLDLDHGTFPFVTSSSVSPLGMPSGSGVPARMVDKFFGVAKAYTTRVGAGPFPTELENDIGQYIRERGHEYGTTTGRPRRCGWFDAVAASYSIRIGSIDAVALMHLDTLAGLDEVKVCTAYEIDGRRTKFFPSNLHKLMKAKCIYKSVPGWNESLSEIKNFNALPSNAKNYVNLLEELLEKQISMIGVGAKRTQTIIR